jgi:hypothetical protein
MTRQECEEAVNRPGKFEHEAVYIPYFYEVFLDGFADEDDDGTLVFKVDDNDRTLFPELQGVSHVRMIIRDDGFVVEV